MIYLDYSATAPMSLEAIDTYVKISKEYIGSISSNNLLGQKAKDMLLNTTKEIASMFNILDSEIIYTNSATEANNMALIGVCKAYEKVYNGKLIHAGLRYSYEEN